MATKILIPTPLRPYTDKQEAVEAEGATIADLLADLTRKHAGLKAHLYNDQGKLRSFTSPSGQRKSPSGSTITSSGEAISPCGCSSMTGRFTNCQPCDS